MRCCRSLRFEWASSTYSKPQASNSTFEVTCKWWRVAALFFGEREAAVLEHRASLIFRSKEIKWNLQIKDALYLMVVTTSLVPLVLLILYPKNKARGRPGKTYCMTIVVNLPQVGVLDLAPTHSEHANMTYQQLLHLHCIQSELLAKATELSLAQGVNLLHSSQDYLQASNNVSCGGCGSVIAHAQ